MTDRTRSPIEPVPGFLVIVDADIARIDAFIASCCTAFAVGFAHEQAQLAQRTTAASARGVRRHAHVAGLPVVGGAR
jgi:hypothetical protein